MKYLLTKNDTAQAVCVEPISDFKYYLFFTEGIKIEKNPEIDGWKVVRTRNYNKPQVLYQYTKEYSKSEVYEDIDIKDLCYKLGYELYKQLT